MRDLSPVSSPAPIITGSNTIYTYQQGMILFQATGINGNAETVAVPGLYALHFTATVISVSKFAGMGYHLNTMVNTIFAEKGVRFRFIREHGQCLLEFPRRASTTFVSRSRIPHPRPSATAQLWHEWLGHPEPEVLEQIPLSDQIKMHDRVTIECSVCVCSGQGQQEALAPRGSDQTGMAVGSGPCKLRPV